MEKPAEAGYSLLQIGQVQRHGCHGHVIICWRYTL